MKWYGRINSQKAHRYKKEKTWAWQGLRLSNAQSKERMKGRDHGPKSPHILHATRDKYHPEHTTESNKHEDSRNGVKAREKQI